MMNVYSFIHSVHFYSASFSPLLLQRRYRLQHVYCIGVSRRSAQATISKGLNQDPYVAARAGVEPTTLRLRIIELTNAQQRPTTLRNNSNSNKIIQIDLQTLTLLLKNLKNLSFFNGSGSTGVRAATLHPAYIYLRKIHRTGPAGRAVWLNGEKFAKDISGMGVGYCSESKVRDRTLK